MIMRMCTPYYHKHMWEGCPPDLGAWLWGFSHSSTRHPEVKALCRTRKLFY